MPEDVVFRTKPELAWATLKHAWELAVPGRGITADTIYGQDPRLREQLDGAAPGCHCELAVPATNPVWIERPPARDAGSGAVRVRRTWTAQTVANVATAWPATAWQQIAVAAGSKGPRIYDWAAERVAIGAHGWRGRALAITGRRK